MRVAIGAMKHESNTFTDRRTTLSAFDPVTGPTALDGDWGEGTATAGIVDTLESAGHEVVATRFGHALPSGVVERDAFEYLAGGIVEGVRGADPDAVCLDLHGSMCAEEVPDPEGVLLADVRRVVGDVPVVASLDMHATVTETMVESLDGVAAYRTAPHTDVYDSGVRAARILCRVADGAETAVERVRVPMLLSGEQSETDAPPMDDLIGALDDADDRPGVFESAYLLGFPWADSPHGGCFAVATGDADAREQVRETAWSLAERFWARHEAFEFTTEAYPLGEAVEEALATEGAPVVISDAGDNPTAGASEDLTVVDSHLREHGVTDALVAVVADPDALAACREAGEGGTVTLELGRVAHRTDAPGFEMVATVETVGTADGVPAAVVESGGVRTVVTGERTRVTDPGFLRELNEEPAEYEIVVVKAGYQSPAYQDIAARSILALTPGDTNCVLAALPYERVPRPIYPLDPEMEWAP